MREGKTEKIMFSPAEQSLLDILIQASVVIILAFIIVEVFLYALRKAPNYEGDGLLDTLRLILVQIQILFLAIATVASSAIAGIANNIVSSWKVYLLAGIAAGVAETWVFNHASIMKVTDQGYTEFYVPASRQVVQPVMNFGRVLFDTGICWYNFVFSRYRVITTDLASILVNCSISNWQNLADATVTLATSPMKMLLEFMMSGLEGNLTTFQVTKAVANVIKELEPSLICACEDLTFAWNITTFSLESDNLHWGIQNTTNAAIELVRIPYLILVGIFRGQFTDCADQPTVPQQIACYIARPPNFTPFTSDVCVAWVDLTNWLDDVIFFLFDQFFFLGGITLPKIGPLLGQLGCVITGLVNNLLAILFHIDLVFGPSSSLKVKYLNFVDIQTPLDHGYAAATFGIPAFWDAFQTQYTTLLGCIFSELGNTTVSVGQFATEAILKFADDPVKVVPFVETYNFNPLIQDSQDALTCTIQFATVVNKPVGDTLNYFVTAVQLGLNATVGAIVNAITTNQFTTYLKNVLAGQLDVIDDNLNSMFISIGNFFRQFYVSGICFQKDPADLNGSNPLDLDFFCCLGNTLESLGRLLIYVLQMLRNAIVAIISGESYAQVLNTALRIETRVIPQFEAAEDAVSCIVSTVFPTTPCPQIPGFPIRIVVKNVVTVAFNITGIPLYFAKVMIDVIRIIANSGSTSQIACSIIVGGYDVTIGNIANLAQFLGQLGGCLISSGLNTVGTSIWQQFGWTVGGLRQQLCSVVVALINAINFLANFFQNPAQTIFNTIQNLLIQFAQSFVVDLTSAITALQNEVNAIGNRITNLIGAIQAVFNCIGGIFSGTLVTSMINCFTSCFSIDDPCGNCDIDYSCNNIPSIKRGESLDLVYMPDTIFWRSGPDGAPPACIEPYEIAMQTNFEPIRYLAQMDFKRCLASAMIARMFDIVLLQANHTVPLVDPLILYDPMIGFREAYGVFHGMRDYISFRNDDEGFGNWTNYATNHSVSAVARRIGVMLEVLMYALNADGILDNGFASLWKLIQVFLKLKNMPIKIPSFNYTMELEEEEVHGSALVPIYGPDSVNTGPHPMQIFSDLWNWTSIRLRNMTITDDPRLLKNRAGFQKIMTHVTHRTRTIYSSLHKESNMFPEWNEYADENKERQISDILCFGETCVHCQILERILDDYVNAILMCIEDSQTNIIVDQNDFFLSWQANDAQKYPVSTVGTSTPAPPSNTPSSGNLNAIIVNWFDTALQWIWPGFMGIRNTGNHIVSFFTNPSSQDPNGAFFWAIFLSPFGCQYQPMTRCEIGPTGLGPTRSVLYVLLFIGIALLVSFLCSASLSLLIFIIPLSYLFFVAIAYLMAPACIFPIPVIPNCMADDIMGMYLNMDVDCIQWNRPFPGLTQTECPTAADGFQRDFPDCSAPPYSFTDGFRNLFFFINEHGTGFTNFLASTTIPLIRAIVGTKALNDSLNFDFSESGGVPDDTWRTCNSITAWANYTTLLSAGALAIVLAFYSIPVIIAMLIAIGGLLSLILVFIMEIVSAASGATMDRSKYFYSEDELPREKTKPAAPVATSNASSPTLGSGLYARATKLGSNFVTKFRTGKSKNE